MNDFSKLKESLDLNYKFPCDFNFKFVVPNSEPQKTEVLNLLNGSKISEKLSKTGKYVSVTGLLKVNSSDHIVQIYSDATKIDQLIAL